MSDMINEIFNLSGDGMTRKDWLYGGLGAIGFFAFVWCVQIVAWAMGGAA